jgi:hypothetical protein
MLMQTFENRILIYSVGNPEGRRAESTWLDLQHYNWMEVDYQGGWTKCTPPIPPSAEGEPTPPPTI